MTEDRWTSRASVISLLLPLLLLRQGLKSLTVRTVSMDVKPDVTDTVYSCMVYRERAQTAAVSQGTGHVTTNEH